MTTWQWVFWLAVLAAVLTLANAIFGRTRKRLAIVLVIISVAIALGSKVYEHSANEQMREPRHLSPEQAGLIYKALSPFSGHAVASAHVGCTSMSKEAQDFALEVYSAIRTANWSAENSYLTMGDPTTGIRVSYDARYEGASKAALALATALRRCHLSVQGPEPADGRGTAVSVTVGDK